MVRLALGKFLEIGGMLIVGLGFYLGITGVIHLHYELAALCAGATVFGLGYLLEKKSRVG